MNEESLGVLMETMGETLQFVGFTIKAIPATSLVYLQSDNSNTIAEKRDYCLHILTSKAKTHNIRKDMTFTHGDGSYRYSFRVSDAPVPDMSGLSKVAVSLTGRANV